jgi:D-3-phosphoglycerate dehydrogenase
MAKKEQYFVIDFDSTFTQVEAMEELAAISLKNDPDKELIIEKIKQLTDLAMEGKMPFPKSLKARIALLSAKKYHLQMLVNKLRKKVSVSFARNKEFFKEYQGRVIIVSGGFKEFIEPVVKPYFIDADCVYANTFVYDKKNNIIGADDENFLAQEQGKVKLLKHLKLKGNVCVIGDGYTDYELFESGMANSFFAFTENVSRPSVISKAKNIASSLDEILFQEKLPMAISFPKSKIKALLWGEDCFATESMLKKEAYQIKKMPAKADFDSVTNEAQQSQIIVFHPNVDYKKLLLLNETKCLLMGVWGELDNKDFGHQLAKKGIALFGSSYAHTRSVLELGLMKILHLFRLQEEELPGKTIGIVGYGHGGSLLSVMALHLGMEVLYYDIDERPPLGNAKRMKFLPDLLKKSDLVFLAAGKRFNKQLLIGSKELKLMKTNALLINMGYDYAVDLVAVKEALVSKKLGGFGIDCLSEETYKKTQKFPQTISSFNKRLATNQTRNNIAEIVSERAIDFMNTGSSQSCDNFPRLNLPPLNNGHRFIHIHKNVPGVLAQINGVLAKKKINISGQYLKTNDAIGYVITDVDKQYEKDVISELKEIPATLKFRVLY